MDQHFPGAAWLRLRQDTFDRLYRYRTEKRCPAGTTRSSALLKEQLE